jgi:cytochrome c oxidase assembly protein subunit 15
VDARRRFSSWALGLLVATVAVILWGAWVRVTGSGAGCADHWPLCNGELVPRSPRVETLIELTHRVTSGLVGLLAVAVFWLARRSFGRGDPARLAAGAALVLMLLEGAIGALLVKKGLVAKDTSAGRAWVVGIHLCNTFLLLGAQVATYQLGRAPQRVAWRGEGAVQLLLALLGLLLLGASGAVTALGDTLFPAASLAAGVADDLSAEAHFLQKLRVYHPLLAVLVGGFVVYVAQQLRAQQRADADADAARVSRWAMRLTLLYVVQVALGSLNLVLLAPASVQVAHLLLADLTWIACVQLYLACGAQPARSD